MLYKLQIDCKDNIDKIISDLEGVLNSSLISLDKERSCKFEISEQLRETNIPTFIEIILMMNNREFERMHYRYECIVDKQVFYYCEKDNLPNYLHDSLKALAFNQRIILN